MFPAFGFGAQIPPDYKVIQLLSSRSLPACSLSAGDAWVGRGGPCQTLVITSRPPPRRPGVLLVEFYPLSPFISLPMMPCSAQWLLLMLHSHLMLKSGDYLRSSVHYSEILRFKDGKVKARLCNF